MEEGYITTNCRAFETAQKGLPGTNRRRTGSNRGNKTNDGAYIVRQVAQTYTAAIPVPLALRLRHAAGHAATFTRKSGTFYTARHEKRPIFT